MTIFLLILIATILLFAGILRIPSTGGRYIVLPKSKEKKLRQLRAMAEVNDNQELVAKAMILYELVLDARADGAGQLIIRRPDGTEEGFLLP